MAADPTAETTAQPQPVFNTFRHRPLRPFYSLREFQLGLVFLIGLVALMFWVHWRGRHPDPSVFHLPESALTDRGATIPIYKRPLQLWSEYGLSGAATPVRLDPFPEAVRSPGWELSGPPTQFDESTLYEKINGREGYYKAFGFRRLHCLGLQAGTDTIDIELFDLGDAANAFGAWAGELAEATPTIHTTPTGWSYQTRNGGFLAQGRYYARLIGSDETPAIQQKITGLLDALRAHLPAEPIPWAFGWFVDPLGLPPAAVRYARQNAFGFDNIHDIYFATIPGENLDVFVAPRATGAQAGELADRLLTAFRVQGRELESGIVQHDVLRTFDAVRVVGTHVVGVRFAPTELVARAWLDKLAAALAPNSGNPYE